MAVHWQVARHLAPKSDICIKSVAELCAITGTSPDGMQDILSLLEEIGAIYRIESGAGRLIGVTAGGGFLEHVTQDSPGNATRPRLVVIKGDRMP